MAQTYGYYDIGEHAWMLLDRVRVDSFAQAIQAVVGPDDVVADVGTGSGILATLAAKAGARKVYAVDRAPILEIAQALFEENGVADRVEIIRGDAREVSFPEPPTVVVSEMVGNFGIEEDMLGMFNTIAKKCVPNVTFIPGALTLYFAPLHEEGLASELGRLKQIVGEITMESFVGRMVNRPIHHRVQEAELLGQDLAPLSIKTVGGESDLDEIRCEMVMTRDGVVNAVGTWYHLDLAPGVTMTTGPDGPATHWTNIKFPVYPPLELHEGDRLQMVLYPKFLRGAGVWAWEVRAGGEVRRGDSMVTLTGDPLDLLGGLRMRRAAPSLKDNPLHLSRLAGALNGELASLSTMAERLFKAMPDQFADVRDARRQLLYMLDALDALE